MPVPSADPGDLPAASVFLDPSGRRCQRIRQGAALAVVALLVAVWFGWPQLSRSPALEPGRTYPAITTESVGGNVPVLGTGPLLRVVRLDRDGDRDGDRDSTRLRAVDPFSGAFLHDVAPGEAAQLGSASYAVERYGYGATATRTLQLTFDDGPDERYTPKLLDLLSREKVPATFCVTGKAAAKHRELVARITGEGHALCNHSFSHADLSDASAFQARAEMVFTDRIIRAISGQYVAYVRPPYHGADPKSIRESLTATLRAQQHGYQVANYDFDTADWRHDGDVNAIPTPALTGENRTVLLHDAGGKREATLTYVQRLIDAGRANGYTFHTMPQVSPELAAATGPVAPSGFDRAALWAGVAWTSWTEVLLAALFYLALVSVVVIGMFNVGLAVAQRLRRQRRLPAFADGDRLPVTVVIAAYNEELVIERTLRALGQSRHPDLEILVVDDGSTDGTAQIVAELAHHDPRIRLIRQDNAGKSSALNRAFRAADAEIVVTLDADTVFAPDTVSNLVRHFAAPDAPDAADLVAVAGVVKVGNRRNFLTRWQALEYLTQIGVDRAAHAALGGIMIVPGACAAWRRDAVLHAGGFSHTTLAEDCDLALGLQRLGYRITQDGDAVAYTEAPERVGALLAQRLRWTFGNLQALWKHRGMMLRPRYGWLGMLVLPSAALSILLPVIFLPFVYLMAVVAVRAQGWGIVVQYAVLFAAVHLVVAAVAVWLMRERLSHLLIVPVHRFVFEPLRAYLVYKSVGTALRGTRLRWNKLQRTGAVTVSVPVPGPVALSTARPLAPAGSPRPPGSRDRVGGPRERYLDTLRALALGRVVVYHVFGLAWLSWVFPSMGVMFALAGSLIARSLDRSAGGAVQSRVRRLLPPFWVLGLLWVPLMLAQGWTAGDELGRELRWPELLLWVVPLADPPGSEWGSQVTGPLWYVRTYLWMVLLSPMALLAFRRWPVRTALTPLAVVAAIEVEVISVDGLSGPVLVDVATFGACWVLGFAHRDGMIRRMSLPMLATLAGVAAAVGGWWALTHPSATEGLDLNEIPLGQALWSLGFVLVLLRLSPTLGWLDRVRPLHRLVTILNARAVTVYLWHEVGLMLSVPVLVAVGLVTEWTQLAVTVAFVAVVVLAIGWVEDLAARRSPRLLPGAAPLRIRVSAALRARSSAVRGMPYEPERPGPAGEAALVETGR